MMPFSIEPAWAACLSAQQASQAIASGAARRLSSVAGGVGGEIVNAQLCDEGGRLVYRLVVKMGQGRVANVVVDARTGQVLQR
ncbi:PepSY domain-containing protein [Hartmannibacter diazotrophicus]|nr:PepSY domain-containing protein [Hartmannibacter diazotrophicus]